MSPWRIAGMLRDGRCWTMDLQKRKKLFAGQAEFAAAASGYIGHPNP